MNLEIFNEGVVQILLAVIYIMYGAFVGLQKLHNNPNKEVTEGDEVFMMFTCIVCAGVIFIFRVVRSPFHNFHDIKHF